MRRKVVGPTTEDTAGSASTAVVNRSSPRSTSGSTTAPGARPDPDPDHVQPGDVLAEEDHVAVDRQARVDVVERVDAQLHRRHPPGRPKSATRPAADRASDAHQRAASASAR